MCIIQCLFFVLQIVEIRISFDGGATSLNFAEAALLIQGSACIYSRKVMIITERETYKSQMYGHYAGIPMIYIESLSFAGGISSCTGLSDPGPPL